MKQFKNIEQALHTLYNQNKVTYTSFVQLPEYKDMSSLFVTYAKKQLSRFISIAKEVNEAQLVQLLTEFGDFVGTISKRRFINLLTRISNDCIKILSECYSPNPSIALHSLERLLGNNNRRLMNYIVEPLINYCSFDYPQDKVLYRVRDGKIEEKIDNCWHTPFNKRQHSYAGRFSSPGFPCLYLADSSETCCAEVGPLKEGRNRWLGTFKLNHTQTLICLDLTIPNKDRIQNANCYDQIQFFLTYPLRLLCTTYAVHKSDTFGEEYLFSQALINLLGHPIDKNSGICRVHGVIYDSTRHKGGLNIALPAQSKSIPPDLEETYSPFLDKFFQHKSPIIIDTNDSVKR